MLPKHEKLFSIFFIILLLSSLLPVICLGFFNHPTGDDYYYGTDAHLVWEETHSVIAAVQDAFRGAAWDYQKWQGTYSAMILMRLQPTVFSESGYQWVTAVILLLFTGGLFYLLKPILCSLLHASQWTWLALSSVVSMLMIQTAPAPQESFFWYNGSMYYTGYLAVTFFFWGKLLRSLIGPRFYDLPCLGFAAFFLAGGNYISLLPSMIMLFLLFLSFLLGKKKKEAIKTGILLAVFAFGFLFSAIAPGNAIRQRDMWKIPAWKAILKSLLQGVKYMGVWINKWWFLTAAVITPFLWHVYDNLPYRFPYLFPTVGLFYGIFCSMSCPTFYTMNSTGPARVIDVCYYGFVLFSLAGYSYFLGWIHYKISFVKNKGKSSLKKIFHTAGFFFIFLLLIIQISSGKIKDCVSYESIRSLASGEAQQYQREYQDRLSILTDPTIKDAILEPFQTQPKYLYVGDLGDDASSPNNQSVALFYHKNKVIVKRNTP